MEPVEAVGLDGDMLEAQAFAYLAVRVLRGLPTSAPGTTGVRLPVSGGRISRPERAERAETAYGMRRRNPHGTVRWLLVRPGQAGRSIGASARSNAVSVARALL